MIYEWFMVICLYAYVASSLSKALPLWRPLPVLPPHVRARGRMGRVSERGDEPLRDAYCGRSSFAPRGTGRHAVVVLLEARRIHGRRAAAEESHR